MCIYCLGEALGEELDRERKLVWRKGDSREQENREYVREPENKFIGPGVEAKE